MFRTLLGAVCIVSLVSAMATPVVADSIAIGNSSFEYPATSTYQAFNNTDPLEAWTTYDSNGLVFAGVENKVNASAPSNTDGDNFGSIQIYGHRNAGIKQLLTDTYQPGQSYTLTAGAFSEGTIIGYLGKQADKLSLILYYMDGADRVTVASQDIQRSEMSTTALNDYSVTLSGVTAGDAWANQQIGVSLLFTSSDETWDTYSIMGFDNIRLEANAVPEPHTMVLLSTAFFGILAYAWRKRK